MFFFEISLIFFTCIRTFVSGQICNQTDTFIKVFGYLPPKNTTILLYSSPGNSVIEECHDRCLTSQECSGFLMEYANASCYRTILNNANISRKFPPSDIAMSDRFFQRACLNVPLNCTAKLWPLEAVKGYQLVDFSRVLYPNVLSGMNCGQLCLSERQFTCRSAMYFGHSKECYLSSEDRRTQPNSYRAGDWYNEYWENQCTSSPFPGTSCSLEVYSNSTMCCPDSVLEDISQFECQQMCNREMAFNCRGFTYIPSKLNETSYCFLHSDDSLSLGPPAIQPLIGATYWEKVPCLDLHVTCTPSMMSVTLHSQDFQGRMYVQGRSERCSTQGRKGRNSVLRIPLTYGRELNTCGIMVAHSVGENNRTLLSTVIIVQYNPIIQRRGDRAVKVGCLLESTTAENVTLDASLSFSGSSGVTNGGTVLLNISSVPPKVSMRIVDRNNEELKEVQLGQNLELRIDVNPENSTFAVHAFDLVATNEDGSQSYFLLDQRGCPADQQTFPALRQLYPGSRSLAGDFRAFKFPHSDIVRFSVTVHFCPGSCPLVNCGGGITSHGRKRRQQSSSTDSMFQEIPLHLAIIVHESTITPSFLSGLETGDTIPREYYDYLCISWSTFFTAILCWILLQFIILGVWFFVVHWHPRSKPQDEHKLEDDFSDFENRHVHWADQDR